MPRVAVSHGRPRPEVRASDLPSTPATAVTARDRDPRTGRFVPGNRASRRRAIKRIAKQLPWLQSDNVEPWAQPYVLAARQHALDLLADVDGSGPLVSSLAEEVAASRLVARALLQLGLAGDKEALRMALQWTREARQGATTLAAMLGQRAPDGDDDPLAWVDSPSDDRSA